MQFLPGQGAMMAILGMTIDEVEDEINLLPKEEFVKLLMITAMAKLLLVEKKKQLKFLMKILKKKRKKEYFYL